jgi:SAM-dependent methyltransferase
MTRYGGDDEQEIDRDAGRIRANPLLHAIYVDIYERILAEIPASRFPRLLEIGAGGGFLKRMAPHAITSECVAVPGVDRVVDACDLPSAFDAASLDAIAAFNVFHHLPDVGAFLRGVETVLRPGGRLVLVEPWFTSVGQWFHRWIHHEPFHLDPARWDLVGDGRMTGANTRLPTSVFRDSPERFAREFPGLAIVRAEPFHKWLYLLSGGLRVNTHIPAPVAKTLLALDRRTAKADETLGIFALVTVERQ